ncbi:RloB family protein [Vibrio sp. Hep-1b-8]|uniref:RloB family protein n=1 Tax=Vibrio sp. Hep-1b-8 TaxID=2144187 RepID=UPI001110B421|nr:RloB family protein [Vibrio sp. Hep-1b-8]TMX42844.1 hypothetical protein DA100_06860 [Vibrio sp. Hep-1b-8]
MARKIRPSRSIKRRNQPTKKPRVRIIAFCEGQNTEPHFIQDFSNMYGNGLVSIRLVPAAGVPYTIVDSCVQEKANQERIYRRSKDPLDKNYQIWAVFDRDDHKRMPATFDKAKGNKIKVAYSNPCFELWPYLYITNQTAGLHRHDMQKKLEQVLDGYDKDKSKSVCLKTLNSLGCYEKAKQRAIALKDKHDDEETHFIEANPSTNAYELFDEIIKNGKPKK